MEIGEGGANEKLGQDLGGGGVGGVVTIRQREKTKRKGRGESGGRRREASR